MKKFFEDVYNQCNDNLWVPQIALSKFYERLYPLATPKEKPILKESILKMKNLEKQIFEELDIFILREDKNKLLESYNRLVSFSNIGHLRESAQNDAVVQDIVRQAEELESSDASPQEALSDLEQSIKKAVKTKGTGVLDILKKVGGKVAKIAAKVAPAVGYTVSAFKFGAMFSFMGPPGLLLGAVVGVGVAKITMEVGKLGSKAGNKVGGLLYDWVSKALVSSKIPTMQKVGQKLVSSPKGKKFIQLFCSIVGGVAAGGITAGALHHVIQGAAQQLAQSFSAAVPEAEQIVAQSSDQIQKAGQQAEQVAENPLQSQQQPQTYQKINASTRGGTIGANFSFSSAEEANQFLNQFNAYLYQATRGNENTMDRLYNMVLKDRPMTSLVVGSPEVSYVNTLIKACFGGNVKINVDGNNGLFTTISLNDNEALQIHEVLQAIKNIIEKAYTTSRGSTI